VAIARVFPPVPRNVTKTFFNNEREPGERGVSHQSLLDLLITASGSSATSSIPGHGLRAPRIERSQSVLSALGPPPLLVSLQLISQRVPLCPPGKPDHRSPAAGYSVTEPPRPVHYGTYSSQRVYRYVAACRAVLLSTALSLIGDQEIPCESTTTSAGPLEAATQRLLSAG
jgi:hypothetical protein